MTKRFIVAMTGASGAVYGLGLIRALLHAPEHEVHLILSPSALRVLAEETDLRPKLSPFVPASLLGELTPEQAGRITLHPFADIGAGPASGTFRFEAMIVCPASAKTLGAIHAGLADNLITRTADVALKEGRPLVLVPRETPLSIIHLRNMLELAQAGAVILPASPGFYHRPATIDALVAHIVQKILDRLGLDMPGAVRWKEEA